MRLPIQSYLRTTRPSWESKGVEMTVIDPAYLVEMSEDDRRTARCRFLIRLAALYYSPEGKIATLSDALGYHSGSLAQASNITAELAVKLEGLLDNELFPRSLFRPDLFLTQD